MLQALQYSSVENKKIAASWENKHFAYAKKDADQLRGNCGADRPHCFRYLDRILRDFENASPSFLVFCRQRLNKIHQPAYYIYKKRPNAVGINFGFEQNFHGYSDNVIITENISVQKWPQISTWHIVKMGESGVDIKMIKSKKIRYFSIKSYVVDVY